MTKKYTVASSRMVRRMPGRPPGSDNPVLKLMKTTTEKAMASKDRGRAEREIPEDVGDQLPKNRDSDMYAVSTGGELVNIHS